MARAVKALVAVTVAAAVVGGGVLLTRGQPSTGSSASATATASPKSFQGRIPRVPARSPVTAGPCTYTPEYGAAAPNVPMPSPADVVTTGEFEVVLESSAGRVVFIVDAATVPCALGSLRSLTRAGYFDDTPCHRLTTQSISVLQCGDPTGTGKGRPGYVFDDEALDGATYPSGTVAMANAGPNTNGSQFFLVYADSPLAPDYTPLGRITSGLDVLQRVAAAGSDDRFGPGDGEPRLPVRLGRVSVRAR